MSERTDSCHIWSVKDIILDILGNNGYDPGIGLLGFE